MALKLGIKTFHILTNNDKVWIPTLSGILLTLWETFCQFDPSRNVYLLAYVTVRRWTLQKGIQMALFSLQQMTIFEMPKFAKVEKHHSILGWHIILWCQHLFLASSVSWSQPHFSKGSIYYIPFHSLGYSPALLQTPKDKNCHIPIGDS